MREILRSKHFVVTVDDLTGILKRTRTPERFASIESLGSAYEDLIAALDSVRRREYGQLIDARQAPPRNDPEFEAVVRQHHAALYRDFRASAAVVQTAAGKLQLRRMFETSGVDVAVFMDEAEAVAFLRRK
jgi:hypothetical protein